MRAISKIIYCAEEGTYGDKPVRMVLSQSNANNKDGNFWCGRTSAANVYNYYQLIEGKGASALIRNQSDRPPYNIVYPGPDGSLAGLSSEGQCAPDEIYEKLGGNAKWEYVTLYPYDKEHNVR